MRATQRRLRYSYARRCAIDETPLRARPASPRQCWRRSVALGTVAPTLGSLNFFFFSLRDLVIFGAALPPLNRRCVGWPTSSSSWAPGGRHHDGTVLLQEERVQERQRGINVTPRRASLADVSCVSQFGLARTEFPRRCVGMMQAGGASLPVSHLLALRSVARCCYGRLRSPTGLDALRSLLVSRRFSSACLPYRRAVLYRRDRHEAILQIERLALGWSTSTVTSSDDKTRWQGPQKLTFLWSARRYRTHRTVSLRCYNSVAAGIRVTSGAATAALLLLRGIYNGTRTVTFNYHYFRQIL